MFSLMSPRFRNQITKAFFISLMAVLVLPLIAPSLIETSQAGTASDRQSSDVGYRNPGPNSGDFPIEAGAYIIDSGALSTGATKQTVNQGLKQYGLVYALVKAKIPVQWVINPNKANMDATAGNNGTDFLFDCMSTGTPKAYKSGAFIIAKEFATQAKSTIDTWKTNYPGLTVDGPCTNSYTNAATSNTVPVFATIKSWPRSVLDAQNGSVAVTYFNNAGIPQGSTTDANNPPAYRFASPTQLTACDDMYVMPHADPTYATHSALINFVKQGGDFYASCHAVSVMENMKNSSNQLVTNFLSTNGIVNYDAHSSQGSPAYTLGGTSVAGDIKGDPIAQWLGTTDAAMQFGSEQIFIPSTTAGTGSTWRPTTRVLVYDQTQGNVSGTITNPFNAAAAILYGPAYGDLNAGLVMYQGGHSVAKGSVDDVASQRAFFNFQMLAAVNNGQVPSATDRTPTVVMTETATASASTGSTFPVAGYAMGGSGTYRYSWASACSDSTGPIAATGTFGSATSASTTFTAPNVPGSVKCNLTLTIIDTCGRFSFGYQTIAIAPTANIRIEQTVSPTGGVTTGTKLLYTARVTNDGSIAGTTSGDGNLASDVTVTIPLPSGGTYDTTYTPTWSYSGTAPSGPSVRFDAVNNKLIFTLKTLSDEQYVTITYKFVPGSAGTFKTVATASTTSFDSDLSDNSAASTNNVTLDTSPKPSLLLEKTPTTQASGNSGIAAFKLRILNNSNTNQSIKSVLIKDEFTPTSAKLSCTDGISGRFWNDAANGATYTIPEIRYQEAWEAACQLTGISAGGTNKLSIVSATADSGTVTSNTSSVTINAAGNLTISKTGPALLTKGSKAAYTITVTNKGSATTGVKISDLLPGGLTVDSATVELSGAGTSDSSTGTIIAWDKFETDTSGAGWKSGATWVLSGTTKITSTSGSVSPFKYANYSMKLSGTSPATSKITRTVQLSTLHRSVSIHFACLTDDTRTATAGSTVNDRINISASIVTPTNETITAGTVNCGTTSLDEKVLVVSGSSLGLTSTLRDYKVVFSLGGTWSGTKSVWLDDVMLVASEIGSDQFTDTTASSWTKSSNFGSYLKGFNVGSAKFPQSGSTYSDGSFLGWNTGSDLSNTASTSISKTFTIDTSQYSNSTVKVSFACFAKISDDKTKLELFFGSSNSASYTIKKDGNSCPNSSSGTTQSSMMRYMTVSVPTSQLTANAVNSLAVKFVFSGKKSSDYIYLDDFAIFGKQLGTVQSTNTYDWLTALNAPGGGGYSLSTNGTITLTFNANVAARIPESYLTGLVNVASVTSAAQSTPTYSSVFTPFKAASIAVLKTASRSSVLSGDTVTVTYQVWNPGNDTLTGVTVSDQDCASLGSKTVVTGNGGTDLQPGERWKYTCVLTVTSNLTGLFTASGTNSSSNTESADDGDDISVAVATMSVTATPAAKNIYPGSTVVYTYNVRNTGSGGVELYKASVTAQNCTNVRFKSGDDNGDGNIDPDETWVFVCTTDAISNNQTGQTVTAHATAVGFESNITSNTATVAVTIVQRPTLTVTKTVRDSVSGHGPSSSIEVADSNTVIYTYTVTIDTASATSVRVSDNGCSVGANPTSGDTGGDGVLAAGETWTFTCTAGKLLVSETATATASGMDGMNNRVQSSEVSTYVDVRTPDAILTINPNKDYVLLGETVTYTYKVKNIGGLTFTSVTPTDTNCAISAIFSGTLAPGETWTFTCLKVADSPTMLSEFNVNAGYSGGTYQPAQTNYQVFVMDPRMTVQKLAQVYVGTTNETRTAFASTVSAGRGDKIVFKYRVSPNIGPKAAPIPGINALVLNAIDDPDCDSTTFKWIKDANGFNVGDTNGSNAMDKDEVWEFTCTAKASVTANSRLDGAVILSPATLEAIPALDATNAGIGASLMQAGVTRVRNTIGASVTIIITDTVATSKKFTIKNASRDFLPKVLNLSDSSSVTVTIDGTIANHTLTYSANGGSGTPPDSQAGTGAMTLASQGSLTRTGYTFVGWSETSTTSAASARAAGSSFTLGSTDVMMYAIWYAEITYDGNGNDPSTTAPTDSTKYLPGATVTIASGSAITRGGANFAGWNTQADGGGQSFAAGAVPTMGSSLSSSTLAGATTLFAKWSTTLSYDGNTGATGSAPAPLATYAIGASATVLDNTGSYAKTGNTFTGWNTLADGSGVDYYAGSSLTMDTFTVLYAQWTNATTYKITYTNGGATSGSVPVDNRNYETTNSATILDNTGGLAKTGYIFNGWVCNSTAQAVGSSVTIASSNITCVASWLANKYSVTYALAGGTGTTPTEVDHPMDETFTVTSGSGVTKSGFTFTKWNDGTTDFLPGATYTMPAANVTLTAIWVADATTGGTGGGGGGASLNYKITFNSNYGTPLVTTQNGYGIVILTTNPYTRPGYTFRGWSTNPGGPSQYRDGAQFTLTSDAILYAIWDENPVVTPTPPSGNGPFTVYLNSNTPNPIVEKQINQGNVNLNSNTFTRSGFIFLGWSTSPSGPVEYKDRALFNFNKNMTLYAVWQASTTPAPAIDSGSLRFEVFFGMNSVIITNKEKANIQNQVAIIKKKAGAKATISVLVEGWVQPNRNPGNVEYLSKWRAKHVADLMKKLGLKATYKELYKGLGNDNIPKARHASVIVTWNKA